jgi:hypothetical protein
LCRCNEESESDEYELSEEVDDDNDDEESSEEDDE